MFLRLLMIEKEERRGRQYVFFEYSCGIEGEKCLRIGVTSLKLVASLRLLDRKLERKVGRSPWGWLRISGWLSRFERERGC